MRNTAVVLAALVAQAGAYLRQSAGGEIHVAADVSDPDDRPMMSVGESMRVWMCWSKPNVIKHKRCMRWMIDTCKERSTSFGNCAWLRKTVRVECLGEGKDKEEACEYLEELGVDVDDDARGEEEDVHEGRPVMSIGESMRTQMCWGKADLIGHDKCMRWMTSTCTERSSGRGICKQFRALVKGECLGLGKHPEHKKEACKYAAAMGMTVDTEDEKPRVNRAAPIEVSIPEEPENGTAPQPPSGIAPAASIPEWALQDKNASAGLPEQGFSGDDVEHENAETQTEDWRKEWAKTGETEGEAKERICKKHPEHMWCKMYLSKRRFDRIPRVETIWEKLGFA